MDTLTTRYCRVAWLPSNRGRMVTWIRSPLRYCCVHVGCIATNSGKTSISIGTAQCFKGKAIHNSALKNGVFWVVTPCGSCKNRRLGETWRLHQGVVPSSPIFVTLMKEAPGSSETSVLTRATRRNNLEDTILHLC
jgi:hypothetical protein